MATKKSQRIAIWVIAVAMIVGTVGGFLVMVLAPQNEAADLARLDELETAYQQKLSEYEKKNTARDEKLVKELSPKYSDDFKSYESRVGSFKASDIKDLKKEDLKKGEGPEIKNDTEYGVYYMGWNPDGKMFDSSFDEKKTGLKAPLLHQKNGTWVFPGGQQGGVLEGWTKGLEGMNIGGVRELSIPSNLAYAEEGQGEDIAPNTPLKFIIMTIPNPDIGDPIERPTMSEEYKQLYSRINKIDVKLLEGM